MAQTTNSYVKIDKLKESALNKTMLDNQQKKGQGKTGRVTNNKMKIRRESIKTHHVAGEIGKLVREESSNTFDQLQKIVLGIISHHEFTISRRFMHCLYQLIRNQLKPSLLSCICRLQLKNLLHRGEGEQIEWVNLLVVYLAFVIFLKKIVLLILLLDILW